jgi:hypothetical protein
MLLNHQASLRLASVNRKIYASLPWGYRVANMLFKLASSDISPATFEALGRVVAAQFILAGVEGLPDIKGTPASSYASVVTGPRGADKLPRGYGQSFGRTLYMGALRKYRLQDVVDMAVGGLVEKMVRGKVNIKQGLSVPEALKYIVFVFNNLCKDGLMSYKRQMGGDTNRTCPECGYTSRKNLKGSTFQCQQCGYSKSLGGETSLPTDSEGVEMDLEDPRSWQFLDSILPQHTLNKLLVDLSKISPKVSEWLQAQLDGTPDRDLAERWGVTPSAVSQFKSKMIPQIRNIFQKYDIIAE